MTESGPPPPGEPDTAHSPAASAPARHFLVQAPVPAMDVDGLNLVTIGIVAFAVASVVTGLMYDQLKRAGNGWWFGVCVSGLALGLVGLAYCWNRRSRRRAGRWDRD